MANDTQQKYEQREKRLIDAIALREPDRVPIVPLFAFFNCYYSGISPRVAYEQPEKALAAWRKTIYDFRPDATYSVNFTIYAMDEVLSGLDFKAMKWPGHGVRDDQSFQFASYRSTSDASGDYLLIDGLNGASRNPYHTFALLELRLAGDTLLSGYRNQVITRMDGLVEPVVAQEPAADVHADG